MSAQEEPRPSRIRGEETFPETGGGWLKVTQKFRPALTPRRGVFSIFHFSLLSLLAARGCHRLAMVQHGGLQRKPSLLCGALFTSGEEGDEALRGRRLAQGALPSTSETAPQGNCRLHHMCSCVQVWYRPDTASYPDLGKQAQVFFEPRILHPTPP